MEQLRELRELAEATSVGPWGQGEGENDVRVYCDDSLGTCVAECASTINAMPHDQRVKNMAFIAAARNEIIGLVDEVEALRAENARLKADRLYIVGVNDGYDAAMDQAAQFCDGAEASWRETADKAHELDHNEAMGWSERAIAKAETCSGLADTIRTATKTPLIRGVGLCLVREPAALTKEPSND